MAAKWRFGFFKTMTGEPVVPLHVTTGEPIEIHAAKARWETRRKGTGSGSHTLALRDAGFDPEVIDELDNGNLYTFAQIWDDDDTVAYAGVIQDSDYAHAGRLLELETLEFRAAYVNSRMAYGVTEFSQETLLSLSGVSHKEALRQVNELATDNHTGVWTLPIDEPTGSDAGSFDAEWKFSDTLMWEDHHQQIEEDGCEIYYRPYLDGSGWLRWEPVVQPIYTVGSPTTLEVGGGVLINLHRRRSAAKQMTGVLGFGRSGKSVLLWAWAGISVAYPEVSPLLSIRDLWVQFPDINDQARLQVAVNKKYESLRFATEQWSYSVSIAGSGPAFTLPGRLHDIEIAGDEIVPDGTYGQRVIAARGDLGFVVTPEVQIADTPVVDDMGDPAAPIIGMYKLLERSMPGSRTMPIARSAYDALSPKDPTVLYAIDEEG